MKLLVIIGSSTTDLAIYMLRSFPPCGQVIKHKVYLDVKTIEAIINIRRLNKVSNVRHRVWMLGVERYSFTTTLYTDTTE